MFTIKNEFAKMSECGEFRYENSLKQSEPIDSTDTFWVRLSVWNFFHSAGKKIFSTFDFVA